MANKLKLPNRKHSFRNFSCGGCFVGLAIINWPLLIEYGQRTFDDRCASRCNNLLSVCACVHLSKYQRHRPSAATSTFTFNARVRIRFDEFLEAATRNTIAGARKTSTSHRKLVTASEFCSRPRPDKRH